jgi:hypothetical protein
MNKYICVVKDLAILAMILIAFWSAYFEQWDKGAFFMVLATYAVLVREEND